MGRKAGVDGKKIATIVGFLYRNPEGVWLSRIAENTGMHPTTVTKYVEGVLRPLVEDISLAGKQRPYLRIVRLKSSVLAELEKGKDLQQIMKILQMMGNYR